MNADSRLTELAETTLATQFVLQSLQRCQIDFHDRQRLQDVLGWYLQILVTGTPVPALCLIVDVGERLFPQFESETNFESVFENCEPKALASGRITEKLINHSSPRLAPTAHRVLLHNPQTRFDSQKPGRPSALRRQYEDYVLGKLDRDRSFRTARDLVRQYHQPESQTRAVSFVVQQIARRLQVAGVQFSPGVIKNLLRESPEELQRLAKNSPAVPQVETLLEELDQDLVRTARNLGDVLGPEDLFELQHGVFLVEFSQRLALRQALVISQALQKFLPEKIETSRRPASEVASLLSDDDYYPVGGYASISNQGSVESLLHSQLAYMEHGSQPDLFDVKFLRQELLYYSRDDNQLFRRRYYGLVILTPDLVAARQQDAHAACQRVIMLMGWLHAAIQQLWQRLSNTALTIEFAFLQGDNSSPATHSADFPLADEQELLKLLLQDERRAGVVHISCKTAAECTAGLESRLKTHQCQVTTICMTPEPSPVQQLNIPQSHWLLPPDGPWKVNNDGQDTASATRPAQDEDVEATPDTLMASWTQSLVKVLQEWLPVGKA